MRRGRCRWSLSRRPRVPGPRLPHRVRVVETDQPGAVRGVERQRATQPVRALPSDFSLHNDELHPVSGVVHEQRLAVKVYQVSSPGSRSCVVIQLSYQFLITMQSPVPTYSVAAGEAIRPRSSCRHSLSTVACAASIPLHTRRFPTSARGTRDAGCLPNPTCMSLANAGEAHILAP